MDWLAAIADGHAAAPAVITPERTVSYGELDRAADGVAVIISASGSASSAAVAFWGDRSIEAIAAVWGIPRAGVTAVAVDPRMAPAAAMDATAAAGVRGLWTTPDGGFDRLVDRGGDGAPPNTRPDVAYVVFTSGSEGRSKGVLLTDENIAAAVTASRERLGNGPADPWLCVLPLFHVGGLSIVWRQAESGGAVHLLERFDATTAATGLDRVAFGSFVPTMLRRILAEQRRWSGLTAVLVGGGATDERLLATARAAGIPAVPTYGMSETCSQVATALPDEPLDGSVGTALSGAEIRVVAEGAPVTGTAGRIEVRGPMVSPGYVGEPGRAPQEWFVTGDVGVIDGAGRLEVVGRADRVIVTGGENVHPAMVERLLAANPEIRAARVFGVSDDEWGMRVVAEVETDAAVDALATWASDRMPPEMRPREWIVVEQIADKLGA